MAERIGRNQGALSPREIEVLELITKGKRNKEIADLLDVSPETVPTQTSTSSPNSESAIAPQP